MKKIFLVAIVVVIGSALCIVQRACSQNPFVKVWDKRYGGDKNEIFKQLIQTDDGGILIGGHSQSSISGDKTENNRQSGCIVGCTFDFWIVKTDSLGNLQWDKTFGGNDSDPLSAMQQTSDGGFILGGSSRSSLGFDKTQNTQGSYDYWIVKTDALGNKLWDKDFGGADIDNLSTIIQTSDGGYLLSGYSNSPAGGDKTQPSQGGYDYWIVKTDSNGTKLWDKAFGGNSDDYITGAAQLSDGGFVLAGYTYSGASGDKSQPSWGVLDYWIIRTDSLGNKLWDRGFGGADFDICFSLDVTPDGNYVVAGTSATDISGDKTQPLWGGIGDFDLWIVKIDTLGNKIWDKDMGGFDPEDELGNISVTADGGFIVGANSYSSISGNKSELNLGVEQSWLLKTDSVGNYMWDRTAFTMSHDESGYAIQTRDGCYILANSTDSPIAGYKSQSNWDSTGVTKDYWFVKFCDSTTVPPVAIATADQLLCSGTCTDFLNLSSFATSFQWYFPGGTPDSSTDMNPTNICYYTTGIYDVTLIATNSAGSDTLFLSNYLTVFPQPPPQGILQIGDTLFANSGAVLYQWFYNGSFIVGATNYFYVAQASGDYNVVATDSNGCEVEAVINDVIASIQYSVDNKQIIIYPNPVTNKLIIQKSKVTSETVAEISIYNLMGEKVISESVILNPNAEIDVPNLSPGLYYLELSSPYKTLRTKFIKQ